MSDNINVTKAAIDAAEERCECPLEEDRQALQEALEAAAPHIIQDNKPGRKDRGGADLFVRLVTEEQRTRRRKLDLDKARAELEGTKEAWSRSDKEKNATHVAVMAAATEKRQKLELELAKARAALVRACDGLDIGLACARECENDDAPSPIAERSAQINLILRETRTSRDRLSHSELPRHIANTPSARASGDDPKTVESELSEIKNRAKMDTPGHGQVWLNKKTGQAASVLSVCLQHSGPPIVSGHYFPLSHTGDHFSLTLPNFMDEFLPLAVDPSVIIDEDD